MTEHVKVYGVKPRIQYTADGSLTTYEFPFAIFSASDLDVYCGDSLQDTATYTVAGVGNSDGGSVTFAVAPVADTIITIVRNLSIERTSDFQEGATLRAKVLNDELDYQVACQQQIADTLNRSMVLPPFAVDTDVDFTMPLPEAGKTIVWSSDGKSLENSEVEINSISRELDAKVSTATTQAGIATTQAGTATTQAGIATTQATVATEAANRIDKIQTNCLTKIPQDIKLELSSGTLTLKSGTKAYVPSGFEPDGTTQKFNTITTTSDLTLGPIGSYTGYGMLFIQSDGETIIQQVDNTSGTSAPAGNGAWYDVTNNLIKVYSSGSDSGIRLSLPVAIIHRTSGSWDAVEQVFNGFGYIGSTAFALPGVKGFIPNGRNADGTLNSTEFTIQGIKTLTESGTGTFNFITNGNQIGNSTIRKYDYPSNYVLNTQTNIPIAECMIGYFTRTSGVISNFVVKSSFHAADHFGKVDVDFNNMNPSATAKASIVNWGMPGFYSNPRTTITSNVWNLATKDLLVTASTGPNLQGGIFVSSNGGTTQATVARCVAPSSGGYNSCSAFIRKGLYYKAVGNDACWIDELVGE